jgi:RNA polymerase sigma factor (sigma-70 family)
MTLHPSFHSEFTRQHEREVRRALAKPARSRREAAGRTDETADELGALVQAAQAGDSQAWGSLLTRFSPMLRAAAREYRLQPADVDDVVQATWEAALSHIAQLREPEAIAGWLGVIVRRQSIRALRSRQREVPVAELLERDESHRPGAEDGLVRAEQQVAVRAAIGRLPGRQRSLVTALLSDSSPSYTELSAKLRMPQGSIGPTRERALSRLRRDRRLAMALTP